MSHLLCGEIVTGTKECRIKCIHVAAILAVLNGEASSIKKVDGNSGGYLPQTVPSIIL